MTPPIASTESALPSFWPAAAIATLGLGAAVATSWSVFGGPIAFRGPMFALRESWPLIYGSQAALAAAGAFLWQRRRRPAPLTRFALIVGAAWIGELAVLAVAGRLLANELTPDVAPFFWFIATAGPMQPMAALLGGWIGLRR